MLRHIFLFILILFSPVVAAETFSPAKSLANLANNPNYVDLSTIPGIAIDLRYASQNNFLNENLYKEFNRAFLHQLAAEKLKRAVESLKATKPGWQIVVLDALRPRSIQKILWSKVKGTSQQPYVANPGKGSIHNFGFALDVTLLDREGKEVDMGTPFDSFTSLAQPIRENEFLTQGKLSEQQIKNRKILRSAMESAGFSQLAIEWWHYDALPALEVRKKYPIIE